MATVRTVFLILALAHQLIANDEATDNSTCLEAIRENYIRHIQHAAKIVRRLSHCYDEHMSISNKKLKDTRSGLYGEFNILRLALNELEPCYTASGGRLRSTLRQSLDELFDVMEQANGTFNLWKVWPDAPVAYTQLIQRKTNIIQSYNNYRLSGTIANRTHHFDIVCKNSTPMLESALSQPHTRTVLKKIANHASKVSNWNMWVMEMQYFHLMLNVQQMHISMAFCNVPIRKKYRKTFKWLLEKYEDAEQKFSTKWPETAKRSCESAWYHHGLQGTLNMLVTDFELHDFYLVELPRNYHDYKAGCFPPCKKKNSPYRFVDDIRARGPQKLTKAFFAWALKRRLRDDVATLTISGGTARNVKNAIVGCLCDVVGTKYLCPQDARQAHRNLRRCAKMNKVRPTPRWLFVFKKERWEVVNEASTFPGVVYSADHSCHWRGNGTRKSVTFHVVVGFYTLEQTL